MTEQRNIGPSEQSVFGPVKQIGESRWEMDYSLEPGHMAHIEWIHEPSPEDLEGIKNYSMTLDPRGESLSGHRWVHGPVTFFWFKNVGPPRWRLPRFCPKLVKDGIALRLGWNFTAYELSVHLTRNKTQKETM